MTVSADEMRAVPSPRGDSGKGAGAQDPDKGTGAQDPGKGTGAQAAADRVISDHSTNVELFGMRLQLPSPEGLAFLAGLGVLAALGIVEWPVVAVIAIGHELAHSHHGRILHDFGEALEQA